ncbi:hypothetical protein B484DRAFT_338876 [Ochromonadaceae sp. CCMP2298]|nr:hypothetical protein B484DRAFT_338876 [Ochromonadaceae sp. CCMP2298]
MTVGRAAVFLAVLAFLTTLSKALQPSHFKRTSLAGPRSSSLSSTVGVESWEDTFSLVAESVPVTAEGVVQLCDRIDQSADQFRANLVLRWKRQQLLTSMLRRNRDEYITVATFLGSRIPRKELPNLQNLPYPASEPSAAAAGVGAGASEGVGVGVGEDLVEDCYLPAKTFDENPLEKVLLSIFRSLVQKEIRFKSQKEGILGLLEEGRHYMRTPEGQANDSEGQHVFVKNVLGSLLTPFLPPFYRLFMAGIIPSRENGDPIWLEEAFGDLVPGKQFGPTFYAPYFTSLVSPVALSFLLGPARANRRSDGRLGGMVVEKCKFLQESNCKGICLHQCKIPAQQFFKDELGLPLTVLPNFETQECQWSWGQTPLPHGEDPDFPKGCVKGCETRLQR